MLRNRRGEWVGFSLLFGICSVLIYVLLVIFGVFQAWDGAMRNGEPNIANQLSEVNRMAITAKYRGIITGWCAFAGILGLLLYIPYYWLFGESGEDERMVRSAARRYGWGSMIAMAHYYLSYVNKNFAGESCVRVINVIQWITAVLPLLLMGWSAYLMARPRLLMRFRGKKPDIPMPTKPRVTLHAVISWISIFLSITVSIFELLMKIQWFQELIGTAISGIVVPIPFEVKTPYDWVVVGIPLAAIALTALNLKYNAPPNIGYPIRYRASFFNDMYTLTRY